MSKYILSLDQGTTSSRAILFDDKGKICKVNQIEFKQIFKENGWVEHDPNDILSSQLDSAKNVILESKISPNDILAIGITNQRETTILWDKTTGKPVYNAVVWQCRRTTEICDNLKSQGLTKFFHDKTGLLIDPYFSATKIKWILENVAGIREKAENGDILFGTVDSWIIWNLTGGKSHCTDYSNASRTMMFNIHTLEWDKEILGLLGIPKEILPKVVPSSGQIGVASKEILGTEIPITGCAGDQQAALFGQCCFIEGDVKNTFGTGGFLLMNTGESPIKSTNGLLTTIGWRINGKTTYTLEGSVFISGAIVKWLRDELGFVETAAQTEQIAKSIENTNGVYVVPAFTGLGAPYWDSSARGAILGLTRGASKAHITRACLEAMAYQTFDVLKAMEEDTKVLNSIKVDGGASENNFLMQFQADILNMTITRPKNIESTAIGAAYLAGLGCGLWKNTDELLTLEGQLDEFRPAMEDKKRTALLDGWKKAVNCIIAN